MTRRDRTTGLPTTRSRRRADSRAGEGRRVLLPGLLRFAIIGVAFAALLAVAALLAYNWYDDSIAKPGKVVLQVGEEEFSLSYYSSRLLAFARSDPSSSGLLVTQALLARLEEEGLTIEAAVERGVGLSDEDVTREIALELGVPADISRGSPFDGRYRDALRNSGLSDAHYRQEAKARAAGRLLRDVLREEVGTAGALVHIRVVAAASLEEAEALRARVAEGEDMGSIAQVESLHGESRQNDGLLLSPPALLDEALQEALADAQEGALLEPVEAGDTFWVIRLERREAEGTYTDSQVARLTELRYEQALEEARSRVTIERDFTTDDANWAIEEAS